VTWRTGRRTRILVARRLHLAFADATYFERLLTRFTVPEELLCSQE
jgi:hypothetical protein